jgi:hypothetical protein
MPLLDGSALAIDVDDVLRAQATDPPAIRARQPGLVEAAERALEEGLPLLQLGVLEERRHVVATRHGRLTLEHGIVLGGRLVGEHLRGASEVVAVLCTVGEEIEVRRRQVFTDDPVVGLALEGVALAALEALRAGVCDQVEQLAAAEGVGVSVPLSPGMEGWPAAEGQASLFALLPAERIGVRLTKCGVMRPAKSLTFVLGLGRQVEGSGTMCDICGVRTRCDVREHYQACTSHQSPAAMPYLLAATAFYSVGHPRRTSSTLPVPSPAGYSQAATASRDEAGEKVGLGTSA